MFMVDGENGKKSKAYFLHDLLIYVLSMLYYNNDSEWYAPSIKPLV